MTRKIAKGIRLCQKQVKPGFTNYLPRVLANKIIFKNKKFRNFSEIWRKKFKKNPEYQKTKFHMFKNLMENLKKFDIFHKSSK